MKISPRNIEEKGTYLSSITHLA